MIWPRGGFGFPSNVLHRFNTAIHNNLGDDPLAGQRKVSYQLILVRKEILRVVVVVSVLGAE
jgi:hypothetical protein